LWYVGGTLSPEQEQDGFAVFEDEDFVYMKRFSEVCLVFSSSGATKESMRNALESILKGSHVAAP
jgi:hypothetical protein